MINNSNKKEKSRGFIALISVIIISAILMIVASTLSFKGFFGRFNALDFEFKEISTALAEACAEDALLKLTTNQSYSGNETLDIGKNSCFTGAVSGGQIKDFKTKGVYQNSHTNVSVSFNTSNFSIVSWIETPNF